MEEIQSDLLIDYSLNFNILFVITASNSNSRYRTIGEFPEDS